MVFWLAVLVGGLFAWMAVKVGFYATWIMFFHVLLAVYMAIFLTPIIVVSVPATTMIPFGHALTLVTVAVATLLIGYGTCYACLSGRLNIPFPQVMDNTAAGVLGFLNGFLILSFASFAFAMTPLSQAGLCKTLGFDAPSQTANTAYVCWWCNQFHAMVAPWGNDRTSQQAVEELLAKVSPPAAKPETPPLPPSAAIHTATPAIDKAKAPAPVSKKPSLPAGSKRPSPDGR